MASSRARSLSGHLCMIPDLCDCTSGTTVLFSSTWPDFHNDDGRDNACVSHWYDSHMPGRLEPWWGMSRAILETEASLFGHACTPSLYAPDVFLTKLPWDKYTGLTLREGMGALRKLHSSLWRTSMAGRILCDKGLNSSAKAIDLAESPL